MRQRAIALAVLELLKCQTSIFPAVMGRLRLGIEQKKGITFYVGDDLSGNVTFFEEMTKDPAKRLLMFPPLDLTKLKSSGFHAELSFFEKYWVNTPRTFDIKIPKKDKDVKASKNRREEVPTFTWTEHYTKAELAAADRLVALWASYTKEIAT